MEQKKLTRDQHLIKLIRESAEKDVKIKLLEKNKKSIEKRLKRLEEDFKRLSRLVADADKNARVLKEKSSSLENEVQGFKRSIGKQS